MTREGFLTNLVVTDFGGQKLSEDELHYRFLDTQ